MEEEDDEDVNWMLKNLNRMRSNSSVNSSSSLIQKAQVERHCLNDPCGGTKLCFGSEMELGYRMRECDSDRCIRVH